MSELARRLPAGPLAADISEVAKVLEGLRGKAARTAFLHVLSRVIDWRGQVITMRDRAYLAAGMPIMVIWGDGDSVLPVAHASAAVESMPAAQLVTMAGVGHFPHVERPADFAKAVIEFVASTEPSSYDPHQWRDLLRRGKHAAAYAPDGVVALASQPQVTNVTLRAPA